MKEKTKNYIKLWIGLVCLFIGLVYLLGQTDCVTSWDYDSLENSLQINMTQRLVFCSDEEKQLGESLRVFQEQRRLQNRFNLTQARLLK